MAAGRPKVNIDKALVKKLAALHCTVDEIADIVGCGRATIYREAKEELDAGRSEGKKLLRTMQDKRISRKLL